MTTSRLPFGPGRLRRSGAALAAILAMLSLALADPLAGMPSGPELRVNTATAGNQLDPAVAVDADGDAVVVWMSSGQDGSSNGVYAQRYDGRGEPRGAEVRVNTHTADSQQAPAVAMDDDGDHVVVWQSNRQDGSLWGVYAQRFDARGVPQGSEMLVNTHTDREQVAPAVAMDADGEFVVAWASFGQDGSMYGVYARTFDASGVATGPETRVNTFTANNQNQPAVDMAADGRFVVAWQSAGQNGGTSTDTYVQRYDANGVAQGGPVRANTYTTLDQGAPSVAIDDSGGVFVAWQSAGQDGSGYGVYGQRYDATGARVGPELRISTYSTLDQGLPSVASTATGETVVTWASDGQDGSFYGVYAQTFDADGAPDADELRVSTFATGDQTAPSVDIDDGGGFLVAWHSAGQDGSQLGVFAQRFVTAEPEVCDGLDNDADGTVDEGVTTTFFADVDGDGHGDPLVSVEACTAPDRFVSAADDADDGDATIHPGAPELCDGKDNDQDAMVDEGWPDTDADGTVDCLDADDDGDGLADTADPDVVAAVIAALPPTSLANGGALSSSVARLDAVERQLASGNTRGSVHELQAMRGWVDGCDGSPTEAPDKNDKVVVCADQHVVRAALDALIANLG